jgi:glycosyltransferase involved in cell wall biosynthesis
MVDKVYHEFLVSHALGGAGIMALRLTEALRERGDAACTWIPGDGPAQQEARRLGLPVCPYALSPLYRASRLRAAWTNWRLGCELRGGGPGLAHVHSPLAYGCLRHALRRAGLKRVVHVQIEEDPTGLRWALKSPPELIITCARFLVEQVRRALPDDRREDTRVVDVPNAVDTARFYPAEDKARVKRRLGAPVETPLLLVLANLAPHKGQDTAVRATALLRRRGVDAHCWLAGVERDGTGRYTNRLQRTIDELGMADRVRLLGFRDDPEELLRAADFFLLPSTKEGLPLSVLEAQASRVPVLAAPTAGIPEVVREGETGFLPAADDAPGYADAIQTMLDDPDLRRRVTEAAYTRTTREYDWQTCCRRILGLYDELLDALPGSARKAVVPADLVTGLCPAPTADGSGSGPEPPA